MEIVDKLVVPWKLGIHMRPAAQIVSLLSNYSCDIRFTKENVECNAKRLIEIFTLEAACGEAISVVANGVDAKEAVEALKKLFQEYREDEDLSDKPTW